MARIDVPPVDPASRIGTLSNIIENPKVSAARRTFETGAPDDRNVFTPGRTRRKLAAALRDQALAALFHRSGWTQERLAKKEGCSPQYVARRLLFGRFLEFSPSGRNARPLTERRFRDYWSRTEGSNERQRFAAVARMINAG